MDRLSNLLVRGRLSSWLPGNVSMAGEATVLRKRQLSRERA